MAALKMKPGDTVEEYTTSFESLAVHTGHNEVTHIECYRTGLLARIVEKIYNDSNGLLPASLDAWKTKARNLDSLYHEYRALQVRSTTHTSTSSNQQRARAAPAPARVTAAPGVLPAPVATTGGLPEAMDVDGTRGKNPRCYNCNRFGHIARDCDYHTCTDR